MGDKQAGLIRVFTAIVQRDLLLALRRKSDLTSTLFFFVVVVSLFPLAIGPELNTLRLIAPGIVWVAALLASMLALDHMFSVDHADGSLEQLLLTPQPLSLLVLAKIFAHWLITGLPLVLIAPVLGLQYDLSSEAIGVLMLSLLMGTPALSLIGAIGAALTLGLRGGGVLVSLLVLPLTIPVLIFGAGAVEANISGLGADGHLYMLSAILVMSLLLAPLATALSLRVSVE
jgi:heme exporter protein B